MNLFWPTLVHKELNSLCIILVTFFIGSNLVGKSVQESIVYSTPYTQYTYLHRWGGVQRSTVTHTSQTDGYLKNFWLLGHHGSKFLQF